MSLGFCFVFIRCGTQAKEKTNNVLTNPVYDKLSEKKQKQMDDDDDMQLEPLIRKDHVPDDIFKAGDIRDIDTDSDCGSHKTLTEVDGGSSRAEAKATAVVIDMDEPDRSTLKGPTESPMMSSSPSQVNDIVQHPLSDSLNCPVYLKSNGACATTPADNKSISSSTVTQDSHNTSRKYKRQSLIEDRINRKSASIDEAARKEKKRLSSVSNSIPLDFSLVENSIDYALETQLNEDKFNDEPESNHNSISDIYRKYIEEKKTGRTAVDPKKSSTSLYSTRTDESEKSCY